MCPIFTRSHKQLKYIKTHGTKKQTNQLERKKNLFTFMEFANCFTQAEGNGAWNGPNIMIMTKMCSHETILR